MNSVEYIDIADGTYTYKVNFTLKTYKLVQNDGEVIEDYNAKIPHIISEASSIEKYLSEEGLQGFKDITSKSRNPFKEIETDATPQHEHETQNMSIDDGYLDDGQPDFQKEIEDLEGPELPVEES